MPLQPRLDAIRVNFEKQASPETLAVMHNATEDLRVLGLADRAIGDGDSAPGFELRDSRGTSIRLDELRAQGPVLLTFFRGHW